MKITDKAHSSFITNNGKCIYSKKYYKNKSTFIIK